MGITIDVTGGKIVVALAGVPHKFVNSGSGPLRQIDIHANDRFITEWLEECWIWSFVRIAVGVSSDGRSV